MNRPRIVVRYFDHPTSGKWKRLAKVLSASIARHCPEWDADIRELAHPPDTMASQLGSIGNVANTHKLEAWNVAVQACTDGDRVLLLDADTMVRRSIDGVWENDFDLAYTVKPKDSRFPFNGGVVFLRVSEKTKAFMARWQAENDLMFRDVKEHDVWRAAYGGINQSALGKILKQGGHDLSALKLPCLEWNVEDEHWATFDPARSRIVHYKSDLQRAVLGIGRESISRELVREWRAMEQEDVDLSGHVVGGLQQPEHHMMVVPSEVSRPEPVPLTRRQRRQQQRKKGASGYESGPSA